MLLITRKALPPNSTEKDVQNLILDWLAYQNCCTSFPIYNGGVYDPRKRIFRKPGKHHRKGIADILGIWKHRPLAIETKIIGNKQSPEQKEFQRDWEQNDGIYILAYKLEDVLDVLLV